jgi:peptidoglycan/LPS O-acetylase OafA/YrhL
MTSTSSAAPVAARSGPSRHIPELDGIRGIAILLVVFYHFGRYTPDHSTVANFLYRGIKGLGWTGVDLFFVLSGYLITRILLGTKDSKDYFKSFYMRRALRILPLYYLAVFLFFDCGLPRMASAYQPAWTEQLWYWLPVSNWHSAFGVLAYSPIGHLWSLAVEEQFYLIWPVVIFFLSENALLVLCIVLIVASAILRSLPVFQAIQLTHPEFLYRLTPFRVEPILFGAIVAISARKQIFRSLVKRWAPYTFFIGIAGVAIASVLSGVTKYDTKHMTIWGYSALGVACCSVVSWAVVNTGSARFPAMIFRSRILTQCGKYSYAMYIFQTPISYLVPIGPLLATIPFLGGFAISVLTVLIGAALAYAVARCSWTLLEQPFLKLKDRFPAA